MEEQSLLHKVLEQGSKQEAEHGDMVAQHSNKLCVALNSRGPILGGF